MQDVHENDLAQAPGQFGDRDVEEQARTHDQSLVIANAAIRCLENQRTAAFEVRSPSRTTALGAGSELPQLVDMSHVPQVAREGGRQVLDRIPDQIECHPPSFPVRSTHDPVVKHPGIVDPPEFALITQARSRRDICDARAQIPFIRVGRRSSPAPDNGRLDARSRLRLTENERLEGDMTEGHHPPGELRRAIGDSVLSTLPALVTCAALPMTAEPSIAVGDRVFSARLSSARSTAP